MYKHLSFMYVGRNIGKLDILGQTYKLNLGYSKAENFPLHIFNTQSRTRSGAGVTKE